MKRVYKNPAMAVSVFSAEQIAMASNGLNPTGALDLINNSSGNVTLKIGESAAAGSNNTITFEW